MPPAWLYPAVRPPRSSVQVPDIGKDCFIVDDQTVAKTNGANTRSRAGKVFDVDADGVWVDFR